MLSFRNDLLFALSKSAYIDSGYFTIAAEKIAEAACEGLNIRRVGVWLFSDDLQTLHCAAFCENGGCKQIEESRQIADVNFPGLFEAILANRLVAADDVITNPVLLVEVLSPSTADFDRGTKFDHYRQIPSLQEYLIFAQDEPHVEQRTRTSDGLWLLRVVTGIDQALSLVSIKTSLTLRDAYQKVDFS